MKIIQLIFLVLLWTVPIVLSVYSFRKMTKEQQLEILTDLKRPFILFGIGLVLLASMLFFTGIMAEIEWLQRVAGIMIIVGGLNTVIIGWIKGEITIIRGLFLLLPILLLLILALVFI